MTSKDDELKKVLKKYLVSINSSKDADDFLAKLTAREMKAIRVRFDIDSGMEFNLEEQVKQSDVIRKRIKEIEEKALKKLRANGPDNDGPDAA